MRQLYPYQLQAVQHIIEHRAAGLFLEMGLGKTAATLTAIEALMYDYFEVKKVLIIAPLRVAEHTWTAEVKEWPHLSKLRISKVLGTPAQRGMALFQRADIYVINREMVSWLMGHLGSSFNFDMVVIDELSSFKSSSAKRFKDLRRMRGRISRMVGLTGTPSPNGLMDLWAQLYLLDGGQRLGQFIGRYQQQYFTPAATMGMVVTKYALRKGAEQQIHDAIRDICISMKTEDYLQLPDRIDVIHQVDLSPSQRASYEKFEEDQVLGEEITAVNAVALSTKLLQFTGGAIYTDTGDWQEIHTAKIQSLQELYEASVGQPLLVFYNFKHELHRILQTFPEARRLQKEQDIEDWNRGQIPMLVAHAAGAGHGLNLQHGGSHVVWYGLPWSLELYQQAVARLHRQGQRHTVFNHLLVTIGTIEDDVRDALLKKEKVQNRLMTALKAKHDKTIHSHY